MWIVQLLTDVTRTESQILIGIVEGVFRIQALRFRPRSNLLESKETSTAMDDSRSRTNLQTQTWRA